MTTSSRFRCRGLRYVYRGGIAALDGLDLDLPEGVVVGLVGRNGSGKTTLLQVVAGLRAPSTGEASTLGMRSIDLDDATRARLGYVPQEPTFLHWLTVRQHLDFVAGLHGRWDKEREAGLVASLELDPTAKISRLTPGDRQKLALILAVCPRPELLVLDEPMSALDPMAREQALQTLLDLVREDGSTILISSHQLRDIERLVDWILMLEKGRPLAAGPMDEFLEGHAEWRVSVREGVPPVDWSAVPDVLDVTVAGRQARLVVRQPGAVLRERVRALGAEIDGEGPANLERLYPALVRASKREASR